MSDAVATYRIEVLKSRAEIEAIREFWSCCCPGRDADLDFYLFFVSLSAETLRPHVVVLYREDIPKALLAGRLEEGRVSVKAGYYVLPVPRLRILRFVHGGCLGEVTNETAKLFVSSIMDSLTASEADVAMLEPVDINSPLVRYASTLPSWVCSDHLIYPEVHRMRDMSGETGAFLARLSSHGRYQHRQRVSKLTRDFPNNRIERFSAPDQVARLMRDVESVAKRSYQRGLGVGFSETAYIESRLEFEARKGWLRAFVLYLDDKPRAFWIGSLRNQMFLSDFLGFDPDYAQYSPGMYLLINVLEKMSSDPSDGSVARIDFGIGDAFYKERLSNRHHQEAPVYIFAPNIKAVAVNSLRSAVGALNRLAKYSLQTMPWLGNVKRKWRAKLTQSS